VAHRAVVAGDDDARLGRVGQHGAGGLPGLLAPARDVVDVGELLLQPLEQPGVRRERLLAGLDELRVQLGVLGDDAGSTIAASRSGT
jgi:hypothetical protein